MFKLTKLKQIMQKPIAKKRNKKLILHGHTRIDPYYWMNQRENPEVIDYLKEENKYLEKQLGHLKSLREKIFNEIKGANQAR